MQLSLSPDTLFKPISSMAAGEYPVGLDEGMGPERTGSGPLGLGKC